MAGTEGTGAVVGVLGPLVLQDDGGATVRLGSGRQRRLLAALALHAGADVACDTLAELVWGDELPADPDGALQTNVARLRRLLPAPAAIGTGPRTYRLDVSPEGVDAARFAAHLARAAQEPGPARRLAELDAALSLWRGRPFAELDHPDVEPEVARLAGLRATAVEQRAEALLAAGRTGEAVAAAEALVAAEPLREGAVAILVCGLRGDPAMRCVHTAGCAASWPSSWAWTRRRSCARCTSRCCGTKLPAGHPPQHTRAARPQPSCRSARSSVGTATSPAPSRCSRSAAS
jgi:DNA-binding SARP family transcriptional activator